MTGGEAPTRSFRRRGLGRGLDALLAAEPAAAERSDASIVEVDPARVRPNPEQPRRDFGEEELDALAASIQAHGLLQPIVVERVSDGYQLVAGERRLRAAQRSGLATIPAVVRPPADSPRESLELALVENLLRQDLNPIEEASAYARLSDGFGLSHEAIALRLGRSRPAVTNTVRLLSLPVRVQELIAANKLTAGHGRALLALDDQELRTSLGVRAAIERITVRDLDRMVQSARTPSEGAVRAEGHAEDPAGSASAVGRAASGRLSPDDELLRQGLEAVLGMPVELQRDRQGGGRLVIAFRSDQDLDGVYRRLGGPTL